MGRQQEIDYEDPSKQRERARARNRGQADVLTLQIPPMPASWTKRVGVAKCKAILMRLDFAQRAHESTRMLLKTINADLQLKSISSVSCAISWLCELGYVTKQQTGRSSWYCLNRIAIRRAVACQSPSLEPVAPPQSEAAGGNSEFPVVETQTFHSGNSEFPVVETPLYPSSSPISSPSSSKGTEGDFLKDTEGDFDWPKDPADLAEALTFLDRVGVWHVAKQRLRPHIEQLDVGHVLEIVRHWNQREAGTDRAAWGVGALVGRLDAATNGDDPRQGWPDKSPAYDAWCESRRRALEGRRMAQEQEESLQQISRERATHRDLESGWGPVLDEMPPGARDRLARTLFPDEFQWKFWLRTWEDPGAMMRVRVLEHLATTTQALEKRDDRLAK